MAIFQFSFLYLWLLCPKTEQRDSRDYRDLQSRSNHVTGKGRFPDSQGRHRRRFWKAHRCAP